MSPRLLLALLFVTQHVWADVPVPPRMLNPKTPAEAWNVINIAAANVERLIRDQRAIEVSDQISLLSPALRLLARSPVKPEAAPLLEGQTMQAFRLVNILTQNSMVENIGGMPPVFENLKQVLADLAKGFDPTVVQSEVFHCLEHFDVVTTKAEETCPHCQNKLLPRRIPYSFVHARAEKPTIKIALEVDQPPTAGTNTKVLVELHHADGSPVLDTELWPMHGQKLQAIITGPDLIDFQQFALTSGSEPGHHFFYFRPDKVGTYRIRIALTPFATGLPEFPAGELEVSGKEINKVQKSATESRSATIDGMQFNLAVIGNKGRQLRAGQLQVLRLQVKKVGGQPIRTLEPLMNAFAHLTGFYTDSDVVVQLHPTGGDILLPDVRGGPALDFKVYAPKTGLLRLHCQVRIHGKVITIPFNLSVVP